MFALNDYLLAGILFLALLFAVIDLWSFEESRDFAKKRLSHYISISETKAKLVLCEPSCGLLGSPA